jgi:hypothetical protein
MAHIPREKLLGVVLNDASSEEIESYY